MELYFWYRLRRKLFSRREPMRDPAEVAAAQGWRPTGPLLEEDVVAQVVERAPAAKAAGPSGWRFEHRGIVKYKTKSNKTNRF